MPIHRPRTATCKAAQISDCLDTIPKDAHTTHPKAWDSQSDDVICESNTAVSCEEFDASSIEVHAFERATGTDDTETGVNQVGCDCK